MVQLPAPALVCQSSSVAERFHGKKEVGSSILPSGSGAKKTIMSQDNLIKLKCGQCKRVNYFSTKNKKLVTRAIELKKFCKWCRKHTPHKESKK